VTLHQSDPTEQRDQLLALVRSAPWVYPGRDGAFMARRLTKMSDRQVSAALAAVEEAIKAGTPIEPDRTSKYAPPTGDKPVILWDHVDGG
jgi:hypothetical protein